MPKPQFPANPIAGIQAISIADQTLQDISRRTMKAPSTASSRIAAVPWLETRGEGAAPQNLTEKAVSIFRLFLRH
jgi:hypothetical protein